MQLYRTQSTVSAIALYKLSLPVDQFHPPFASPHMQRPDSINLMRIGSAVWQCTSRH